MNAEANHLEIVAFHLTGDRSGGHLTDVGELELRPALFAGYGDLTSLRYDYPLVLADNDEGEDAVRTLSGIFDGILSRIAPQGVEGEFARKQLLGLEHKIRSAVASGAQDSLVVLWQKAGKDMLTGADGETSKDLGDVLARAEAALTIDGQVIDCDGETPGRVLRHLWTAGQREKNRRLRHRLDKLILGLNGILQADFAKSEAGRSAERLKDAMGGAFEATFDFDAMSNILPRTAPDASLPDDRSLRLRATLKVLETQRFVPPSELLGQAVAEAPYEFVFDSCVAAKAAFEKRLPELVALAKALSVAELEVENRFKPPRHEQYFETFDQTSLRSDDLAQFPSYLVLLSDDGASAAVERALAIDLLSSGLPVKLLVQTDDLLGEDGGTPGQSALGGNNLHFANMAIGINSAYVFQSASAGMHHLRDRIIRGLDYAGPALFSIFSGGGGTNGGRASYLAAASAAESRGFPAFIYDPAAGPDWASRFSILDNPQVETDWPEHSLSYEAEHHRRVEEKLNFTFVDFVAADRRYARHLAGVANGAANNNGLMPAGEYLQRKPDERRDNVPYVLMVDGENVLRKIVVGETLIRAAERCGESWHALQELGGVHNSHATRLLVSERHRWDEEKQRELEALRTQAAAAATARADQAVVPAPVTPSSTPTSAPVPGDVATDAAAVEEPDVEAAEVPTANPDEAWIETPRCTTCNECTDINNQLFAYNENQQAYILDLDAGTFKEMVEAAENCQVSIIHPGKPRNPKEANLGELIKRAEPFI